MKIFKNFKSIFQSKPDCNLGVHETIMFDSVDEFYQHLLVTDSYKKHNIYYYNGEMCNLNDIIRNQCLDGEKSINDLSLEYPQIHSTTDNKVVMVDSLFFPDDVSIFKKNYKPGYDVFYRTVKGRFKMISKVLIAKNDVYFSAK